MSTLLSVLGLVVLASAAVAGLSAAPWLPTKPSQRRHLVENLEVSPQARIIDLGCGDGSVLFALAKKYPQATCVGYDISLLPLAIAWFRKLIGWRQYANVLIYFGNLFTAKISSFDIIIVFLLAKSYPKLQKKLTAELAPEARVIIEAWPLASLQPTQTIQSPGLLPVYIYTAKTFRD